MGVTSVDEAIKLLVHDPDCLYAKCAVLADVDAFTEQTGVRVIYTGGGEPKRKFFKANVWFVT